MLNFHAFWTLEPGDSNSTPTVIVLMLHHSFVFSEA